MENEQQDFVLEMCEQPIAKKPRKYKAKDVKVQYRCQDTEDWVDMLINESIDIENLVEIAQQESFRMPSGLTRQERRVWAYECFTNQDKHIKFTSGASLKFIGIDEGVDITNDLNSLTKEKYFKPKEKQIENNAWNGGKNKRFSGYKSYY